MILLLSLVLGILPLLGVVWIFVSGMITIVPPSASVDGLFMTLILLTLSLCFFLNAFWEARDKGMLKFLQKQKAPAAASKPAVTPKPATAPAATPAAKAPVSKVSS